MKQNIHLKYISNRVICLGSVLMAGLLAASIYEIVRAIQGEDCVISAVLLCSLTVFYAIAGWFWILIPYQKSERMINKQLMENIMHSPQVMDLNKRQAQYLALQNQINPHFLYNTLESIRGEALIAKMDGIADMTEALAKFFRYTITKVENLVSVEEELDNCETYFCIQKYRFGDRLNLHIEYDPEDMEEIMNCRIPKLTLQPILENSIIHGTELKMEPGNIFIRFTCTQNRLIICVSDDGVGMDEDTLAKLNRKLGMNVHLYGTQQEEQGGIALGNVNNRIRLLFGDEYGMHVYSALKHGTDVEITLPLTASNQEVKNGSVLI